ncbi:cilia- and flagella-associated protein 221 isoform X1 [Ranitomeya variabilis]|uniref:cilia- and flagella-associated protein 221 isoform X1 n=2 Tax=Ranitomeya variabilis TaxID=490064 RepID=UPI00405674BC
MAVAPPLMKPSSSSVYVDSLMENPLNRAVPNHLLESRVYMKLGSNVLFAAEPAVLHFGGFEIGKTLHQVLKLVNISADVSNVHIIPPQSKHFTINYKKADRFAPGLAITVDVQFVADEWRYYYDCIRVHGKGEETLLVPLHAFPVMDLMDFPSHVSLSAVPLGRSALHVLRLCCRCPVDFEFCFVCSPPHKDFTVSPASGVVPGGGLLEVTVTYTPSSYGTAQVRLELLISEFNARPRVCVVTGTCCPLLATRTVQPEEQNSPKGRLQGGQRPYGASRKRKHLRSLQQSASQVTEFPKLRFPVNLSNPHAVSTILNQQSGKLRAGDLRGGISHKKVKTRPAKETRFQELLQQNVAEEAANQLRWQVYLGCDPMSVKQRRFIMEDHQRAESQAMSGSPDLDVEYRRAVSLAVRCRVLRHVAEDHRPPTPMFDLYLNDLWANRSRALSHFQQAGRTVVIRGRVDGRLRSLRKLLQHLRSVRKGSRTFESSHEEIAPVSAPRVLLYEFPPYPTEPGGLMAGHLVSLPPQPAAAPLRHQLFYHGLKVPQHFRQMAYEPVRRRWAADMYQTPHLARPLRSGAEDELMPEVTPPPLDPAAARGHTWSAHSHGKLEEEKVGCRTLLLRPPEMLLNPPDFHPMHVFTPAPGLMAFKRSLAYSDIDLECHLCPLPKYSPPPEATGGPARRGHIRGVPTLKRFPEVYLSTAFHVPDVCRPRGCDPFCRELLPVSGPPAHSSLPAEDKEIIVLRDGDSTESKVLLTLDMLRAEFTTLQSRAPHNLDNREESLVPVEGNLLAEKLQGNVRRMKLLSREAMLILD